MSVSSVTVNVLQHTSGCTRRLTRSVAANADTFWGTLLAF